MSASLRRSTCLHIRTTGLNPTGLLLTYSSNERLLGICVQGFRQTTEHCGTAWQDVGVTCLLLLRRSMLTLGLSRCHHLKSLRSQTSPVRTVEVLQMDNRGSRSACVVNLRKMQFTVPEARRRTRTSAVSLEKSKFVHKRL